MQIEYIQCQYKYIKKAVDTKSIAFLYVYINE